MKLTIPKDLKGKELATFLLTNKEALISEKKEMLMKHSDTLEFKSAVTVPKKVGALKDASGENTEDPLGSEVIHVTAVANVFNYLDSQMDVLITDCCKRTLKERAGKFKQIHDHIYKLEAKIGEVTDVYTKQMQLSEFGLTQPGNTQALIFEFDCYKSYNQQIFNQYKAGKVDQYSIGLQYVSIDLAIYDEESPKEMDFWNKYIDIIINKDVAVEAGYFFVVSEIRLLENSAVLFGANDLTFTYATSGKTHPTTKDILDPPEQDPTEPVIEDCTEFSVSSLLKIF